MTSANVRGRYLRYSASATRTSYPSGLIEGPPVHPSEPAYPCCLPALGRFTGCTPHEGLRQLYPLVSGRRASVSSSTEDSPRGLGRTLGKRFGLTPSGVRISYPPPTLLTKRPAGSPAVPSRRSDPAPAPPAPGCRIPPRPAVRPPRRVAAGTSPARRAGRPRRRAADARH